jgi:hypothetical protein
VYWTGTIFVAVRRLAADLAGARVLLLLFVVVDRFLDVAFFSAIEFLT